MSATEHTYGLDLVVEIDFEQRLALVGERVNDGFIMRYYRLRVAEDGSLHRDVVPPFVSRNKDYGWRPPIVGESYTWQDDGPVTKPVHVAWTKRPALVDRSDLRRLLDDVWAVSGKSTGLAGLVTVTVSPRSVHVASMGTASVSHTFERRAEAAANTGLGSCVVLAAELRKLVKESSGMWVQLEVSSSTRELVVNGGRLWTANISPLAIAPAASEGRSFPLGDALMRALPFASKDDARPNLHCVRVEFHDSGVDVMATDGHRVHFEYVPLPASTRFPAASIPASLLARASMGKRRMSSVSFSEDGGVSVESGGFTFRGGLSSRTFPPVTALLSTASSGGSRAPLTVLSVEGAKLCAAWLRGDSKNERVDVGGVWVDIDYLHAALEQLLTVGEPIKIWSIDVDSPVEMRAGDMVHVLMGMRD